MAENNSKQSENFRKAFKVLQRRIDEYKEDPGKEAYQFALLKAFELIHELSLKVLKEHLENKGADVGGSPKAVLRNAFQNELIANIEPWMESIAKRNKIIYTYNEDILKEIIQFITDVFHPTVRDLHSQLKKV